MPRYQLTDDAREDLREIKKYSLKQFGVLVTRDYLAGLQVCMQRLSENSKMGTSNTEGIDIKGLWHFIYVSHTIYYLPASHGITIVGILHQSRLPDRLRLRGL
ncbi:toxin ParE1/3/4 [Enterobacter sp. BIGb0383]|uniref:type II toxin-antitoxin system RelE/ParE family toxin n=1 Tax=unclassified Enterobacter TaxID=2608935 RepID=UPI000F47E796|nr:MULTISPECIES: type II toxin-antitoxin system RelE/ParE family toxin [unclassified Enterobacter]ROP50081.1 toxin ParE1/3/4 [Enterobacter sp. BIGb0383]ROS06176.1 toxin ParE1/3/4 [Enterobacter sp. BIGb0359]